MSRCLLRCDWVDNTQLLLTCQVQRETRRHRAHDLFSRYFLGFLVLTFQRGLFIYAALHALQGKRVCRFSQTMIDHHHDKWSHFFLFQGLGLNMSYSYEKTKKKLIRETSLTRARLWKLATLSPADTGGGARQ